MAKSVLQKGRGFLGEFKAFASRSNFIDVAVGITLASAFGRITSALVDDVFMPLFSLLFEDMDFTQWNIVLREAQFVDTPEEIAPLVLGVGSLLGAVINFILIAFVLFLLVRTINRMRDAATILTGGAKETEAEPAPEPPAADVVLLTEIRDLLAQNKTSKD